MKGIQLIILGLAINIQISAQNTSHNIEVWGVKEKSPEEFLSELDQDCLSITAEDLKKSGYKNGAVYKYPGDITIITLRDYPELDILAEKQKKSSLSLSPFWKDVTIQNFIRPEAQAATKIYAQYQVNDTVAIHNILHHYNNQLTQEEGFGNKKQVIDYCVFLDSVKKNTSFEEILTILSHSDNPEVKQAAAYLSLPFIQSHESALKLFPFFYDDDISPTISNILENYYTYRPVTINWYSDIDLISKIMNHPSPFVLTTMIHILTETFVGAIAFNKLLKEGSVTIMEVLESTLARPAQKEVIRFLRENSKADYGDNVKKWITYVKMKQLF